MKITIDDRGSVVYIHKEMFAPGQSEEDTRNDYRILARSLEGCARGDCSDCILCRYEQEPGKYCDDELKKIAAARIRWLAGI